MTTIPAELQRFGISEHPPQEQVFFTRWVTQNLQAATATPAYGAIVAWPLALRMPTRSGHQYLTVHASAAPGFFPSGIHEISYHYENRFQVQDDATPGLANTTWKASGRFWIAIGRAASQELPEPTIEVISAGVAPQIVPLPNLILGSTTRRQLKTQARQWTSAARRGTNQLCDSPACEEPFQRVMRNRGRLMRAEVDDRVFNHHDARSVLNTCIVNGLTRFSTPETRPDTSWMSYLGKDFDIHLVRAWRSLNLGSQRSQHRDACQAASAPLPQPQGPGNNPASQTTSFRVATRHQSMETTTDVPFIAGGNPDHTTLTAVSSLPRNDRTQISELVAVVTGTKTGQTATFGLAELEQSTVALDTALKASLLRTHRPPKLSAARGTAIGPEVQRRLLNLRPRHAPTVLAEQLHRQYAAAAAAAEHLQQFTDSNFDTSTLTARIGAAHTETLCDLIRTLTGTPSINTAALNASFQALHDLASIHPTRMTAASLATIPNPHALVPPAATRRLLNPVKQSASNADRLLSFHTALDGIRNYFGAPTQRQSRLNATLQAMTPTQLWNLRDLARISQGLPPTQEPALTLQALNTANWALDLATRNRGTSLGVHIRDVTAPTRPAQRIVDATSHARRQQFQTVATKVRVHLSDG